MTLLQQVDTSLQDQTKSLDTLRHHINTAFSALLSDRQGFIHSQVKIFKQKNNIFHKLSHFRGRCS